MRTIIAGSRTVTDFAVVEEAVRASGFEPSVVISGGAAGADRLGEIWASQNDVPLELWLADWRKDGKLAGILRNEKMAVVAEALIAVWDGTSRGTADMIRRAQSRGLAVYVHEVSQKL